MCWNLTATQEASCDAILVPFLLRGPFMSDISLAGETNLDAEIEAQREKVKTAKKIFEDETSKFQTLISHAKLRHFMDELEKAGLSDDGIKALLSSALKNRLASQKMPFPSIVPKLKPNQIAVDPQDPFRSTHYGKRGKPPSWLRPEHIQTLPDAEFVAWKEKHVAPAKKQSPKAI